ncbi:Hsp70 family protein [Glycomyces salinus]|uniref:Hsp70 family protein n=1 Tax=Glycomyces salinus TaxID=980294 RepID=UPI0018EAA449|nr:Hsp70 family protein [Glycomyces salinus]
MQSDSSLAVDFGTSNTVAVLRRPGEADRPLLFSGAPVLSSAVYADAEGGFCTGLDAHRMAQFDPARLEAHPKQRVDDDSALLGEREVPVVELIAAVLARVREAAVEANGTAPPAILTHPVQWGPRRLGILTDAAREAGLVASGLVAEPVAAAHRLSAIADVEAGKPVCVFDLGAGTLDVAVLRPDGDGWAVAAQGGSSGIGGLYFDHALVEHLGGIVAERYAEIWGRLESPGSVAERRDRARLWEEVRHAKEMLSRSAMAPLALPGVDQALHLTLGELERVAGPAVARAVAETERVLAAARCAPRELGGLFLVGGASRMPPIGRALHTALGVAPTGLEQPELAVATGAFDAPPDDGPGSVQDRPRPHFRYRPEPPENWERLESAVPDEEYREPEAPRGRASEPDIENDLEEAAEQPRAPEESPPEQRSEEEWERLEAGLLAPGPPSPQWYQRQRKVLAFLWLILMGIVAIIVVENY